MSKAGVWYLSKKLARDLAPAGIRVNSIGPGFIETNMTEPWDTLPTFAIELDGRLIGTVNFMIEGRVAMIGYALARAQWGKGYATEASRAAIAWLLASHELDELWASTNQDNTGSRRVLEKLGLVLVEDGPEVRYSRAVCTASVSDRTGA